MLTIVLEPSEDQEEFKLQLEHSLVSLRQWEAEFKKAFFSGKSMEAAELIEYIRLMVRSNNPPEGFLDRLTQDNFLEIMEYINQTRSATWFDDSKKSGARQSETMTAELIYYWMTEFKIPVSAEDWHLSQLLTLIRVCGLKKSSPKKMNKREVAEQYRKLNAERRQKMGTNG